MGRGLKAKSPSTWWADCSGVKGRGRGGRARPQADQAGGVCGGGSPLLPASHLLLEARMESGRKVRASLRFQATPP